MTELLAEDGAGQGHASQEFEQLLAACRDRIAARKDTAAVTAAAALGEVRGDEWAAAGGPVTVGAGWTRAGTRCLPEVGTAYEDGGNCGMTAPAQVDDSRRPGMLAGAVRWTRIEQG